ncbi:lysylphosphatidylglycerol synthase transmembrane domain-containing protein [Actinacidiphila acididurans]|uniref:lysylphosphatidylglycerol synthase transmembrane domain-containing protein n=1 Tax=Actinacidiphila acididurans TaxID=2784346 RepID=UPI0027DE3250|nr:lysylphosphatidylglycerol synthase domain-containing protein [Actinacidiphila acididurans]
MSIARNEDAFRQRAAVKSLVMLVPVLAVAALAAAKWPLIDSSAGRLGSADAEWMTVAGAAAFMTWVCSATAQQGAVVERLPPGRLLATQFAASAANHVLPAGVGGNAVNLRFLVRRGLTPARAVAALAVRAGSAVVGRLVLLAALFAAFPGALRVSRLVSGGPALPAHPLLLAVGVALTLALVAALLRYVGRLRDRLREFAAAAVCDLRILHGNPSRVAALWGGSVAFPAAHAAVVVAVSRAVHMGVPVGAVAVAYLFASTAAGWLPTPAGLGSLDAVLALTLVTAGASGVTATSAVLGYRLMTTWLPLLPGVLVLAVLVRRRVL